VSVALHHVVDGPAGAPPLLLGNSLGTDTTMWDRVVAELGDRFRLVRFDHRGQGASDVPRGPYDVADLGADVIALLDELQIGAAAYCGVSVGGMVGLWLASHAPERVERLVVWSSSAHPGNPEAWSERAATVLAAGSTAPIADTVVARWVTPAFAAERPDVVSELRAMLLASPAEGYAACCGVLERLDLRPDLGRVRAPTLVVSGAGDEAIPPEHGLRIAEAIPGARFELLDPAAHIPMAERPDAVAALILEHLEVPHD
jgi:3-oxoadipate enol-lactonase